MVHKNDRYQSRSTGYQPKAGDVIFFCSYNDTGKVDKNGKPIIKAYNHTGIVTAYDDPLAKRVYTIEGNSGDAVKRKWYGLNDSYILGYGANGGTEFGNTIPTDATRGRAASNR